ncbi:hypothetical protein FHR36_005705 [Kitasatospora paracochleata]|uniref:Uncharacterized protein n=1 Tax=Kitasatospora paracochleata TaxID=58354 RepID=A0ABT1J5Y5_9ACTN|nr:hypothetical protein [Kitasatospora paracochleata]
MSAGPSLLMIAAWLAATAVLSRRLLRWEPRRG